MHLNSNWKDYLSQLTIYYVQSKLNCNSSFACQHLNWCFWSKNPFSTKKKRILKGTEHLSFPSHKKYMLLKITTHIFCAIPTSMNCIRKKNLILFKTTVPVLCMQFNFSWRPPADMGHNSWRVKIYHVSPNNFGCGPNCQCWDLLIGSRYIW